MLALLDQAGQVASASSAPIYIISSGISTADPLDLRQLGWRTDPSKVIQDLRERELLPRYLTDRRVTFFGLGQAAGSQPRLPAPDQEHLKALSLGVCEAAGAAECIATEHPPPGPPRAGQPVPKVPVTQIDTATGVEEIPDGECRTLVRLPAQVLFSADTAELQPTADKTLADLVHGLPPDAVIAEVAGHAADFGPDDGMELSGRRARAVAERLQAQFPG